MKIQDLLNIDCQCDCNTSHKCWTKNVLVGENISDQFVHECRKILTSGHIGLVYMQDCKNISDEVRRSFIANDYNVTEFCYASMTIVDEESCQDLMSCPEDIRMFVGVGAGSISNMIRFVGSSKDIPTVLFATAPSSISVFDSNCVFEDRGCFKVVKATAHLLIAYDYNVISHCSQDLIASGYGEILSESINYFDAFFINTIDNKVNCNFISDIKSQITYAFSNDFVKSNCAYKVIVEYVIKLGLLRQLDNEYNLSTIEIIANCIQERGIIIKPVGINKFFAFIGILQYYRQFLSMPKLSIGLDNDIIKKCYNYARIFDRESSNVFCTMPQRQISLINLHIYEEYKKDFYKIIKQITDNVKLYIREFRRLFCDVGFWISDYISASDIIESIQNSSIMCPSYGLMCIADAIGLS